MPYSDLLIAEFDEEMAATRRMLERVPDGKAGWQPHQRSMTLGRLATHVAEVPAWTVRSLTLGEFDISPPGAPPFQPRTLATTAEVLAVFDKNVVDGRRALAAAKDAEFSRPWTFKRGGQVIWTKSKHEVYRRMALNHMVHHRAQLGVYLRLQELPVPGMYGPSADEQR